MCLARAAPESLHVGTSDSQGLQQAWAVWRPSHIEGCIMQPVPGKQHDGYNGYAMPKWLRLKKTQAGLAALGAAQDHSHDQSGASKAGIAQRAASQHYLSMQNTHGNEIGSTLRIPA